MYLDWIGRIKTKIDECIEGNTKKSSAFWALLDCFGVKFGGAERNRTADLLIANEALSQLSYSPI